MYISMNALKIGALIGFLTGGIILGVTSEDVVSGATELRRKEVLKSVIERRTKEEQEAIEKAKATRDEMKAQIDHLRDERETAILRERQAFREDHHYDETLKAFDREKNQAIADFDKQNDISAKRKAIKDEMELRIQGVKKAADYDSMMTTFDKEIRDLESDREDSMRLIDTLGAIEEDYKKQKTGTYKKSEWAKKSREELEADYKEEIGKIEQKKADLKKSVDKDILEIKKSSNDTLATLENQRKQFVDKANSEYSRKIKDFKAGEEKAIKDVTDSFDSIFGEAQSNYQESYDESKRTLRDIQRKEDAKVNEIMSSQSLPDMIGAFLKDRKASVFLVGLVGVLPIVLGEFAIYKYTKALIVLLRAAA